MPESIQKKSDLFEDAKALYERMDWDLLGEKAYEWLQEWTGITTRNEKIRDGSFKHIEKQDDAKRDAVNQLFEKISQNPAKFWALVFRRCKTFGALKGYLIRCYKQSFYRQNRIVLNWLPWFEDRISTLLGRAKNNRFCTEKISLVNYFGLIKWGKSSREIGIYAGLWADAEEIGRRYPAFPSQRPLDRKSLYTDEQIETGSFRLLDEREQYCKRKVLADGMIKCGWVDLDERYLAIDDYDLDRSFSDRRSFESEVVAEAAFNKVFKRIIAQLSERQIQILFDHHFSKLSAAPEDQKKHAPLALSGKYNVSDKRIYQEIRAVTNVIQAELREWSDGSVLAFIRVCKKKFEENQLAGLLNGETPRSIKEVA